jgi:hypothetical protein
VGRRATICVELSVAAELSVDVELRVEPKVDAHGRRGGLIS